MKKQQNVHFVPTQSDNSKQKQTMVKKGCELAVLNSNTQQLKFQIELWIEQLNLLKNFTGSSVQQLRQLHSNYLTNVRYHKSVYFLKGNDSRKLDLSQQKQFMDLINKNSLQTSCLVFNPVQVERKLEGWYREVPWIHPHYAVKANPIDQLVQQLVNNGAGLDCASRSEIQAALRMSTPRKYIVYSNPVKDESDLKWAEQNGIRLTTADSIDELHKIKQYAPNMRILWRISIKEEASDQLSTPFSGKFGDDLQSVEKIHERMAEIAELGIKLKGIHFHCGSGHHGSSGFKKAVIFARNCLQIGREYGHEMDLLDVGGGFPTGDLSQATVDALKLTRNDPLGYEVIAEPGRHFAGHSCYLLTRVLGKRVKNGKPCYHLNESLYHSFNCNLMDSVSFQNQEQFYSKIDFKNQEPSGIFETENSTLFGMTCDGLDIITKNIGVPTDVKVGDWLCISGMGAYTYGCRSNFNGMKTTEKIITLPLDFEPQHQGVLQKAMLL